MSFGHFAGITNGGVAYINVESFLRRHALSSFYQELDCMFVAVYLACLDFLITRTLILGIYVCTGSLVSAPPCSTHQGPRVCHSEKVQTAVLKRGYKKFIETSIQAGPVCQGFFISQRKSNHVMGEEVAFVLIPLGHCTTSTKS